MSIFDSLPLGGKKTQTVKPFIDISKLSESQLALLARFTEMYVEIAPQNEKIRERRREHAPFEFIRFLKIPGIDIFTITPHVEAKWYLTARTKPVHIKRMNGKGLWETRNFGVFTIEQPARPPTNKLLWEAYRIYGDKEKEIKGHIHPHVNSSTMTFCVGNDEHLKLITREGDLVGIFSYYMDALHTCRNSFAFMELRFEDWPLVE